MTRKKYVLAAAACVTLSVIGHPALASVTQEIEPASIRLDEAARLTIAASGADATSITPPMVSGLEFLAVAQSQRIESINGVTRSTTSITYQVIPQRTGVFTIPSESAGAPPVVLTVNPGSDSAGASGNSSAGALPSASSGATAGPATRVSANGSAFVRLRLPKHDLYVGETIPVDIQVGTRDGVVASLNGEPTLNGDAFTLSKLSAQPQRSSEVIDGKPFTVFTWHSALAAVKPGHLSLTMETPLTVRIRSAARPDAGMFGQMDIDDLFNDPALQNFFGASTEKDITVASLPAAFDVQALPTQGRPADFSGAVGDFTVSSDASADKAAAGDPLTLRLHVEGSGDFDRVSSPMLHDVAHWKTYAPTASFKPEDQIGYRGEKTFDQPVIATQPGEQALPALAFSWFDPATRRYVEAHTSPLRIAVAPAESSGPTTAHSVPSAQPSQPGKVKANGGDSGGLRPDHADAGGALATLQPYYFSAPHVVAPSLLALAFLFGGFWVRRRERVAVQSAAGREQEAALQTAPLLTQMDQAAGSRDAQLFFKSARQAVIRALASRWHMPPSNVTPDEAKTRLGPQTDVARLFELADEATYSKVNLSAIDFKHWKRVVLQQINDGTPS
jgi:hypothetical protein